MNRLIVISLFFVLLFSCKGKDKKMEMPLLDIEVVAAKEEFVPYRYTFVSTTESANSYIIEPRISGYLNSKNYSDGMPVKKGELLFTIDPESYQLAVDRADASLASAKSTLVNAQSNYDRVKPLADLKALSQSDLDDAIASLASAKAQYNVALAEKNSALLDLSYTIIRAPHKGIISTTNAAKGDYIGVGTDFEELATIYEIDTIAINLSFPMAKYLTLRKKIGESYSNADLLSDITLTLSDNSLYPHTGIYSFTKSVVNEESGAITFQVLFPNPNYMLKPNQFARVVATVGEVDKKIIIPQKSVSQSQNIYSVWVIDKDKKAEYRQVVIGGESGSDFIIESGLTANELVATNGFFKLREGMTVNPKTK